MSNTDFVIRRDPIAGYKKYHTLYTIKTDVGEQLTPKEKIKHDLDNNIPKSVGDFEYCMGVVDEPLNYIKKYIGKSMDENMKLTNREWCAMFEENIQIYKTKTQTVEIEAAIFWTEYAIKVLSGEVDI